MRWGMQQIPQEQILAAAAVHELAEFLGTPITTSQLRRLHLLLSRATDATRSAIGVIEASVEASDP